VSRLREILLFCTLAAFWGLSFPAITVGLEYLPPLLFAALRYDVATILLLGYAVARMENWRPVGWNNYFAILGGGVFLVAGNGFLFLGQQTVPSGVAAILQALVPIATAVCALFLLGERLSLPGAIGVGIGFVGISLVVQPDPNNLLGGETFGRLLIVGQVISVSLGGVIVQRTAPSISRVPLTGWSMLVGAVILHLVSLGTGELPDTSAVAPTAVGTVLYLGVFSTAIAFYIYFYIIEVHGAFEVSLVAYLVPVVATLAGVFILQETISVLTFLGFGLVAAGFVLLKREALADVIDGTPVAVGP